MHLKRQMHIVRIGFMENGKIGRFEGVQRKSYRHIVTKKIGRTAYVIYKKLNRVHGIIII